MTRIFQAFKGFIWRAWSSALVKGFVGALIAIAAWYGAEAGYGWCRWHLYGRNDVRINVLEQNQQQIVRYLQAQEAKGAK